MGAFDSRSPSWGAWIETRRAIQACFTSKRRSPSWGAWIETPRTASRQMVAESLPLVGSVD